MNGSVIAMDVIQQKLNKGVLITERILQSHFHIPGWTTKVNFNLIFIIKKRKKMKYYYIFYLINVK